jgi:hypothetical protein
MKSQSNVFSLAIVMIIKLTKCMDPNTHRVFSSRHIIFHEHSYNDSQYVLKLPQ